VALLCVRASGVTIRAALKQALRMLEDVSVDERGFAFMEAARKLLRKKAKRKVETWGK